MDSAVVSLNIKVNNIKIIKKMLFFILNIFPFISIQIGCQPVLRFVTHQNAQYEWQDEELGQRRFVRTNEDGGQKDLEKAQQDGNHLQTGGHSEPGAFRHLETPKVTQRSVFSLQRLPRRTRGQCGTAWGLLLAPPLERTCSCKISHHVSKARLRDTHTHTH